MIVRELAAAEQSNRKITDPNGNWNSVRMLLDSDKMGFSFHITTIFQEAEFQMHYTNHLESVYCISGFGEIEDLESGEVHKISSGTLYALNNHDKHVLRALTEMKLACVFNPALHGTEIHNKHGAYESNAEPIKP